MNYWLASMISIAGILIVLLIVFAIKQARSGKKHEPDYYTFFIMGVIWTAFGLIFWSDMPFFFIMGLAFMAIGLANTDKWKKHKTWKQLTPSERKLHIWLVLIGLLVLIAGIVTFVLVQKGII